MSDSTPARLEHAILDLLTHRAADATICPSEAARQVGDDDWRDLMQPAREAVARLAGAGLVAATQAGATVDALTATGPIRVAARQPHSVLKSHLDSDGH
ncbi:DUF3253 domain-containing protein [Knoellia sp. S7-12]|uniref:DUF3253 domain-containing protein n=1 Tax=Knoellia sp. S7-12 TaxID=3126698 RepID=UPI003367EDA4